MTRHRVQFRVADRWLWGWVDSQQEPTFRYQLRLCEDAPLREEGGFVAGTVLRDTRTGERLPVGARTSVDMTHRVTSDMLVNMMARNATYEWAKPHVAAEVVGVERVFDVHGQWAENTPPVDELHERYERYGGVAASCVRWLDAAMA